MQILRNLNINMNQLKTGGTFSCPYELSENVYFFSVDTHRGKASFFTYYFEKPTMEEIEDIKEGQVQYGIFSDYDVLVFLIKFGNMPWFDIQGFKADMGDIGTVNILLVDSDTNEILVNRKLNFPEELRIKYLEELNKPVPENFKYLIECGMERVLEHNKFSPDYLAQRNKIFTI